MLGFCLNIDINSDGLFKGTISLIDKTNVNLVYYLCLIGKIKAINCLYC